MKKSEVIKKSVTYSTAQRTKSFTSRQNDDNSIQVGR